VFETALYNLEGGAAGLMHPSLELPQCYDADTSFFRQLPLAPVKKPSRCSALP